MSKKFQSWKAIVIVVSVVIVAVSVTLRLTDLISVSVFGWGMFASFFLILVSFPEFIIRIISEVIGREVHGHNYENTRVETFLPERKRD